MSERTRLFIRADTHARRKGAKRGGGRATESSPESNQVRRTARKTLVRGQAGRWTTRCRPLCGQQQRRRGKDDSFVRLVRLLFGDDVGSTQRKHPNCSPTGLRPGAPHAERRDWPSNEPPKRTASRSSTQVDCPIRRRPNNGCKPSRRSALPRPTAPTLCALRCALVKRLRSTIALRRRVY